ncbi:MAG: NACHT domain-containing protein, partial [Candidatus Promineifilaceae bacterium]
MDPDPKTTKIIATAVNWLWTIAGRDFASGHTNEPNWFRWMRNRFERAVDETKWRFVMTCYYQNLFDQVSTVRVLGKNGGQFLEKIYTDVNVLDKESATQRYNVDYLREHFAPRSVSWYENLVRQEGMYVLRQNNKLFILGKPGAGKTTFMKWAALQAIQCNLDYFPIFVNLKELSDKRPDIKMAKDIFDYITHLCQVHTILPLENFIEHLLITGRVLMLFDGLDEVNLANNRRASLINAINDFVKRYGGGKILITCRVAATDYSFSQFNYVEMADFTPRQMAVFIDNWFATDIDKARRCKQALITENNNKTLQELAQVPLLITLLCLTFEELDEFPVERSQIYE